MDRRGGVLRYGSSVGIATYPGQHAKFNWQEIGGLTVRGGYGYRVVMRFEWFVGSTRVGVVEDTFNHAADYVVDTGVRDRGCWI